MQALSVDIAKMMVTKV